MKVYKLKINYHNAKKSYTKGTRWLKIENRNYYRPEDEPKGHDLHMDFVEKNPDIFEDCTEEWLIEEAIRRYPIGTKFIGINQVSGPTKHSHKIQSSKAFIYDSNYNSITFESSSGIVYSDKYGWAEIVKEEPLFTTEDGVEVFEGDTVFQVRDGCGVLLGRINQIDNITSKTDWTRFKYLFSSTKEKAQEYIDLNKPQYSKQDVIDAIKNALYIDESESKFKIILDELDKNA